MLENCIVQVPKKACHLHLERPSSSRVDVSSYESVRGSGFTSVSLTKTVKGFIIPLQFTYRENRGIYDAVLFTLNSIYSHMETSGKTIRLILFGFSSAFNTIRPHLMVQNSIVHWVLNYLTNRPQFVSLKGTRSAVVWTNTGAPQGTYSSCSIPLHIVHC